MTRRTRNVCVLAAALVLLAGCNAWPMIRFDPGNSGSNRNESRIGVSNVGTLTLAWTANEFVNNPAAIGGLVGVGGQVYVTTYDDVLRAFNAAGNQDCSGDPKQCTAIWRTADAPSANLGTAGAPAVGDGKLFVRLGGIGIGGNGFLYAFDEFGSRDCVHSDSGCPWLWQSGGYSAGAPTYANGMVYMAEGIGLSGFHMAALDADTGTDVWYSSVGGFVQGSYYVAHSHQTAPAVARGVLYAGSEDGHLYTFSANGTTNCSGSPRVCTPLWTANIGVDGTDSSPVVVNGVVYITGTNGVLYAFDAAGQTNCSGNPKMCTPLWTADIGTNGEATDASPAVANGVVYAPSTNGNLYALDAAGVTNCSGRPKTCAPLWSAKVTAAPTSASTSPVVANGVVYIGSADEFVYAFDAAGTVGCAGAPKVCTPLWSVSTGADPTTPVVAGGFVYFASAPFPLKAYTLPR